MTALLTIAISAAIGLLVGFSFGGLIVFSNRYRRNLRPACSGHTVTYGTVPVSLEATLAEATVLADRLSFLLACAVNGPFAGRPVPDSPNVPSASASVGELS